MAALVGGRDAFLFEYLFFLDGESLLGHLLQKQSVWQPQSTYCAIANHFSVQNPTPTATMFGSLYTLFASPSRTHFPFAFILQNSHLSSPSSNAPSHDMVLREGGSAVSHLHVISSPPLISWLLISSSLNMRW